MKSTNAKLLLLIPFGGVIYLLNALCLPQFGMLTSQVLSAIALLVLLAVYLVVSSRETDEREKLLQLQSDSAALYIVIAGLLAAAIFYPHSEVAMVFWLVVGLAVGGRIITFIYQRNK